MMMEAVLQKNVKSLSVIGMVKNAGKTVVLNHLIEEAAGRHMLLGVTSVGRDGEKTDEVYAIRKPRITIQTGVIVATTQASLKNSTAQIEVLLKTGLNTAMGEIIIGRASKEGQIELTGPSSIKQQIEVKLQMQKIGAHLVLVDGALDRISTAAPTLTDGVILATGAALGGSMQDVLEKTRDRVERLTLERVEDDKLELCQILAGRAKAVLIDRYFNVKILETEGSLVAGKAIAGEIDKYTRIVLLSGAVGNDVLHSLNTALSKTKKLELVIRNGTCLFSDRLLWQRFKQRGGTISVLEPIRLLAVTINPTSPGGMKYDAEAFLKIAGGCLSPLPVYDVILGKKYVGMEEAKDDGLS